MTSSVHPQGEGGGAGSAPSILHWSIVCGNCGQVDAAPSGVATMCARLLCDVQWSDARIQRGCPSTCTCAIIISTNSSSPATTATTRSCSPATRDAGLARSETAQRRKRRVSGDAVVVGVDLSVIRVKWRTKSTHTKTDSPFRVVFVGKVVGDCIPFERQGTPRNGVWV